MNSIESFVSSNGFVVAASDANMVTIAPRRGARARFVILVKGVGEGGRHGHVVDAERAASALAALGDDALAQWVRDFARGESDEARRHRAGGVGSLALLPVVFALVLGEACAGGTSSTCQATPYHAATAEWCACEAAGGTLEPVNVGGDAGYLCTAHVDGGAP